MARLRSKTGKALSALYERTDSFASVVAKARLVPLSVSQEETVRETLGRAIGVYVQGEDVKSAKNIIRTLSQIAEGLELSSQTLSALATGLHPSHEIEVSQQLAGAVARNPKFRSLQEAQDYLVRFQTNATTVAHAARVALEVLDNTPDRGGREAFEWHDEFTRAVVQICEWNGIKPTISTHRETSEPGGRFLEIAAGLEKLLYPAMRAPSRVALTQRLKRSLKKLKA